MRHVRSVRAAACRTAAYKGTVVQLLVHCELARELVQRFAVVRQRVAVQVHRDHGGLALLAPCLNLRQRCP